MLDLKFIREHEEELKDTIKRQKKDELLSVLDEIISQSATWREMKQQADDVRAQRNKVSEAINAAKKEGKDIKDLLLEAKEIPQKIKAIEEQMSSLEANLRPKIARIPNIMHKDVPYGKDDTQNPEVKSWGKKKEFDFPIKNHVELCEALDIANFETSAKTTGAGFYFLKGDLALLNQALINFAVTHLMKKNYTYLEPPLMVRKHVLDSAMDTNAFAETIYSLKDESEDPLCMIGTAEHVILGMHENEVLKEEELPRRYAGYSMCFRQEIGSHGINEKGLWRTHQFNKVEQFIFCLPEQSWAMYDELMQNSEEILQALELPYRIVEICTGDLAVWKARSHDFEVWRPTTKGYGEVMSLSNCTTYQAIDLNTRYVKKNGERGVLHTLNNTAMATSRIMVAILENYQNKDGSITVPKVLQGFVGKKVIQKQ